MEWQLKPTQLKALKDIVPHKKRLVDMATGTGKTIVGLVLLDMFVKPNDRALIICPPILINNVWIPSSEKFGLVSGRIKKITAKNRKDMSKPGIYICSYNIFTSYASSFKKYKWEMTILDE